MLVDQINIFVSLLWAKHCARGVYRDELVPDPPGDHLLPLHIILVFLVLLTLLEYIF